MKESAVTIKLITNLIVLSWHDRSSPSVVIVWVSRLFPSACSCSTMTELLWSVMAFAFGDFPNLWSSSFGSSFIPPVAFDIFLNERRACQKHCESTDSPHLLHWHSTSRMFLHSKSSQSPLWALMVSIWCNLVMGCVVTVMVLSLIQEEQSVWLLEP